LCVLCGGDGLADIFGRKFGKGLLGPLPYFKGRKTIAGSLGMFIGSLLFTIPILGKFDKITNMCRYF
jgi:dolichol kinase